jgi:hypothetical protein
MLGREGHHSCVTHRKCDDTVSPMFLDLKMNKLSRSPSAHGTHYCLLTSQHVHLLVTVLYFLSGEVIFCKDILLNDATENATS